MNIEIGKPLLSEPRACYQLDINIKNLNMLRSMEFFILLNPGQAAFDPTISSEGHLSPTIGPL